MLVNSDRFSKFSIVFPCQIRAYDNGQFKTFSGQIDHLSGQIKFGQANLLYIINGKFTEFTNENELLDNFQSLS